MLIDWFAAFGAVGCGELVEEVAAGAAGFFDFDADSEFAGRAAGIFVGLGFDACITAWAGDVNGEGGVEGGLLVFAGLCCEEGEGTGGDRCSCSDDGGDGEESDHEVVPHPETVVDESECDECGGE